MNIIYQLSTWQNTKDEVKAKIEKANAKYKATANKQRNQQLFEVGDQVMIFLRKERIPIGIYKKLQPRKYGAYMIVFKINDNVYFNELSESMFISKTFNVADLFLFHPVDAPLYLKENAGSSSFQVGENDVDDLALNYLDKREGKRG